MKFLKTQSQSLAQKHQTAIVAAVTSFLLKRWAGLTPYQLERITWVAATAALTQELSAVVYYKDILREYLAQHSQTRTAKLNKLPQFMGLQDTRLLMHSDAEADISRTMAAERLELVHLEVKTMWNENALKETLYQALLKVVPELKHSTPVDYSASVKALKRSPSKQAAWDTASINALRQHALRYAARGISQRAAHNFVKSLRQPTLAKADLVDGVSAGRSLSNALFDFMLHVKNRLDLRDIRHELANRSNQLTPQLKFGMPQAFQAPILCALAPKAYRPKERFQTYAMLHNTIQDELVADMNRANVYMASPERNIEIKGIATGTSDITTEMGALPEPTQAASPALFYQRLPQAFSRAAAFA